MSFQGVLRMKTYRLSFLPDQKYLIQLKRHLSSCRSTLSLYASKPYGKHMDAIHKTWCPEFLLCGFRCSSEEAQQQKAMLMLISKANTFIDWRV